MSPLSKRRLKRFGIILGYWVYSLLLYGIPELFGYRIKGFGLIPYIVFVSTPFLIAQNHWRQAEVVYEQEMKFLKPKTENPKRSKTVKKKSHKKTIQGIKTFIEIILLSFLFSVIGVFFYESSRPIQNSEPVSTLPPPSSSYKDEAYWSAYRDGYNEYYKNPSTESESYLMASFDGYLASYRDHNNLTVTSTPSVSATSNPASLPLPLPRK